MWAESPRGRWNFLAKPVNEWHAITFTHAHPCQYLFRCVIVALAKFIWWVNRTPTLQQVCSVILLQIIHFNFMLSWVLIHRNPLYYIVFRSKNISVSNAKNNWAQLTWSYKAAKTFDRTRLPLFGRSQWKSIT